MFVVDYQTFVVVVKKKLDKAKLISYIECQFEGRGCSSVGRASHLHCGGRWFEPSQLHKNHKGEKMIKPMDARVVVKKPTRAEQTESGIILPDTVDEGTQTSQGEVLAVGPGSRNMNTGEPMPMDVKVGDRVIYTKYQGVEVNHNGEELFVIMERDIIAIVEE